MTMLQYNGVIETETGRYAAVLFQGGRESIIGIYDTPETAAMIWDIVMFELNGEFAILNFPELIDDPLSGLVPPSPAW